jgi:dethiobiotin synthetase
MKPFCSGGLGDVHLLQSLQRGELSDEEMNPFYFRQPLAPLVAARKNQRIRLGDVVSHVNKIGRKCKRLLIEGSGGLLVPLGENFTVADLIGALDCSVIVAARNRLGTINHTLLTVKHLQSMGIRPHAVTVVLMASAKPDLSSKTNPRTLAKLLAPARVLSVPNLGKNSMGAAKIAAHYLKARPMLLRLES